MTERPVVLSNAIFTFVEDKIIRPTKIMDEADKLKPFLVRVLLPDPLSSLERVHNVWQIQVRIAFVDLSGSSLYISV